MDRFEPSSLQAEPPPAPSPRGGVGIAITLGVAAVCGGMAVPPAQAMPAVALSSAVPVGSATRPHVAPEVADTDHAGAVASSGLRATPAVLSLTPEQHLARDYGVSDAVIHAVPVVSRKGLETVPPDMRTMYRSLDAAGKKKICDNLHQSTHILFVPVSHRSAFIRGTVVGFDVFGRITGRLDDAVAHHEVTADQAATMRRAIEMARNLSPDQRAALVTLLETEQRLSAPPHPAPHPKPAAVHSARPTTVQA